MRISNHPISITAEIKGLVNTIYSTLSYVYCQNVLFPPSYITPEPRGLAPQSS